MYIRWTVKKARVSTSRFYAVEKTYKNARRGDLLVAHIVENRRIDGKPRQRVLAYLASIRTHWLTTPEE